MAVCRNCSTELVEGSRFCHMCGTEVVYKAFVCGDCGYPLRPGAKFCGKCGSRNTKIADNNPFRQETFSAGFAGTGTENSTRDNDSFSSEKKTTKTKDKSEFEVFQEKIDDLEAEFIEYKNKVGEVDAKRWGCPAIDIMIRTISDFAVPDDSEEILKFIRLATVEIDDIYGRALHSHKIGIKGEYRYTDITLSHIWLTKMEQAYQKAKRHYFDEPVFKKIDKVYRDKMRKLGKYVP